VHLQNSNHFIWYGQECFQLYGVGHNHFLGGRFHGLDRYHVILHFCYIGPVDGEI
jgi:hypothetical protein